ncbi:hypothetical protein FHQ18_00265 [Deferribacter autotrophicus]|uniref:Type 4 fimbrial biogenesis protein PilX N-terminal domain-containing protein n=1 Tax=Deferribacter autotrophicus TaxID=500465 RepID=A0A5A8F5E3_9BACT|nr:hypothetical protein [Deferribacter autotrophicus]KAA0259346.1 hypothetical protein FHQ18_00265 [Deferribacter autotrophicus]
MNNKGMALIVMLGLLLGVFIISSIVSYRIIRTTKSSGAVIVKNKTYYAANSGIENARKYLNDNYVSTNYWSSLLDNSTDKYNELSNLATTINDVNVKIYIKDNNDGDNDYGRDSDLRVFVLSEAAANDGTKTIIETILFYDSSASQNYKQYGQNVKRTNVSTKSGLSDIANVTPSSFNIGGY